MRLTHNVLANYGGQAVSTVVALITVPLYLHLLGIEGYGLVSLLLVLQAVTVVLDFGISTTANREVASYIAQERPRQDRLDLVRTLEVFYYGTAVAIFLSFAVLSPWLASNWLTRTAFDSETVRTCLLIAGASIALRWPTSLYQGILRGTERQVVLNVITSASTLVRGIGSILVLAFISRSVVAFYWAQLLFSFVEVAIGVAAIRWSGDGFEGPGGRFDSVLLRRLWRFSVNVGGLSLFALILKQFDKIVISSLLPLTQLGFYNAASVASNGLTKFAIPVQSAVFPRLTRHQQRGDDPELARTFHAAVQGITFLTAPLAFILIFFARDVLWVWTRNADLAAAAGPPLSVLSAAILFNTMMSVPFSLLLACGLTWLPLAMNGAGVVVLAPLTFWLVKTHGITGAAVSWLVFNILYYLIVPHVMFRHVLRGEYRAWFVRDTLPFTIVPLVCFGLAWRASAGGPLLLKASLAAVAGLVYVSVILGTNRSLRQTLLSLWTGLRRSRPNVAGVQNATASIP